MLVLLTLLGAAAVAANLGRRLTRPLREAQVATGRIASGDLAARVPENPADGEELAGLARSINAMAEGLERSRRLERQFLLGVARPPHAAHLHSGVRRGHLRRQGARSGACGGHHRHRGPPPRAAGGRPARAGQARRQAVLPRHPGHRRRRGGGRHRRGFRPAADAAGVSLTVGPEEGITAAADPDRLAQVLANLIENALKFARRSITIGSGSSGQGITVWVEDDGPGIPVDDLPHVFEPFWQSSRSPARDVGTGLGLAIVAELVAAMGGTATAEPVPTGGIRMPTGGTRMVVSLRPWHMATRGD